MFLGLLSNMESLSFTSFVVALPLFKNFIYLFGCSGSWLQHSGSLLQHTNSSLQHVGSSSPPDQGLNLGPLHWEQGIKATGPSEKSLKKYFTCKINILLCVDERYSPVYSISTDQLQLCAFHHGHLAG